MNKHTKLLIECENNNDGIYPLICLITDNHKEHIKSHLKYIYKFRIFKHVLQHLKLMREQKRKNIPIIEIEFYGDKR